MKKIINIVEDEKDLNELVKSYLEKEGYIVNSYLTFDAAIRNLTASSVWKRVRMIISPSRFRQRNWS